MYIAVNVLVFVDTTVPLYDICAVSVRLAEPLNSASGFRVIVHWLAEGVSLCKVKQEALVPERLGAETNGTNNKAKTKKSSSY